MTTDDQEAGLDASLQRKMEMIARQEAEEAERDAATLAVRQRSLVDVAWEATQSGRGCVVRIGELEFQGVVAYARGDLMTVETPGGMVEVQLGNIDSLRVVSDVDGAGRSVPNEAESFAARMSMLQLSKENVEIVTCGATSRFSGRVTNVARDHVVIDATGGALFVPLDSIACAFRR